MGYVAEVAQTARGIAAMEAPTTTSCSWTSRCPSSTDSTATRDPPAVAGQAAADRRDDCQRDGRRSRGVPRGRHERLRQQAHQARGARGGTDARPVNSGRAKTEGAAGPRIARYGQQHARRAARSVGGDEDSCATWSRHISPKGRSTWRGSDRRRTRRRGGDRAPGAHAEELEQCASGAAECRPSASRSSSLGARAE